MKAQLLIEFDLASKTASVTRMYDLVVGSCSASKPMYSGSDLKQVGMAIAQTVQDLILEAQEALRPKSNIVGMGDSLNHGADGFGIKLECGHPNVRPNERCPLCGKSLWEEETQDGRAESATGS